MGACWYLLGIQRAAKCLKEQCIVTKGCNLKLLACEESIYYGTSDLVKQKNRLMWGETINARLTCLKNEQNFDYGAYKWTVQLVTNENHIEKILLPIFWGLMTLRYVLIILSGFVGTFQKYFFNSRRIRIIVQYIWKLGEHNRLAGRCIHNHCSHYWSSSCHYVDW